MTSQLTLNQIIWYILHKSFKKKTIFLEVTGEILNRIFLPYVLKANFMRLSRTFPSEIKKITRSEKENKSIFFEQWLQ